MTAWERVFSNSLWLVGLALLLAVASYASYKVSSRRLPAGALWRSVAENAWARVGAILFCTGMALTGQNLLEATPWCALALYIVYILCRTLSAWLQPNARRAASLMAPSESRQDNPGAVATLSPSTFLYRAANLLVETELLWLALLSPAFLFPAPLYALALLGIPVLWLARWVVRGRPVPATPLDSSLALLATMLLVSLYATFDIGFSLPKITGLLFGIACFYGVVGWSSAGRRLRWGLAGYTALGAALSIVGLLGTEWKDKLPVLKQLGDMLPSVVRGLPGAENGIHPNELAGALLWIAPFQLALLGWSFMSGLRVSPNKWAIRIGLLVAVTASTGTLLLTQSRSAYGGFLMGLTLLTLLALWRFRWALALVLLIAGAATIYIGPERIRDKLADAYGPGFSTTSGDRSIGSREEIWSRALYGIEDFPLTGMGMGTFRRVMPLLYPTAAFNSANEAGGGDIGHAHNHLLQAALDLGLPGLVAYLSLWLIAPVIAVETWRSSRNTLYRATVAGIGASLLAYFIYGITDTVALGAKPGVYFWLLFALLVSVWQRARAEFKLSSAVRVRIEGYPEPEPEAEPEEAHTLLPALAKV